jgi:hypothetical protein
VSILRVGLVILLALAAAVVANLVLLGVADGSNDPVGRLSPRAELITLPAATTTAPAAPATTTPPAATSTGETTTRPHEGGPGTHQDD